MDNISLGEGGGIFAGLVALFALVGKGIAWVLDWHGERTDARSKLLDQREALLHQREAEYREAIEHELAELRSEMAELKGETKRLRSQQSALSFSLLEVAVAHRDKDPHSPALSRAAVALRQAFPVEFGLPAEIAELIHALEGGHIDDYRA